MSIKRKGSIQSRRMRDVVELFENVRKIDDFGAIVAEQVSMGEVSADVEEIGGSRFAYYQSIGFSHPLNIIIRKPSSPFYAIAYNGRMLKISSAITDPENREYVKIVADYTDDQI